MSNHTLPFDRALAFTLRMEGGWYDGSEARDPNPTMKGVTQKTYDTFLAAQGREQQSVQHITDEELEHIYMGYWLAADCDSWYTDVAMVVFDMAVNAGSKQAVKLLQRVLGVTEDGFSGPLTRRAYANRLLLDYGEGDHTANAYQWERVRFYRDLAVSKKRLLPNLPSWLHRILALNDEITEF